MDETPRLPRHLLLPLAALAASGCAGALGEAPTTPTKGMLRRAETRIVDTSGAPVELRGVAFANEVYTHNVLPESHHDESDFGRVSAMGMNVVRFYMNYRTFEDDAAPYSYKEQGFGWIDRNVAWAKKHGVRLILNLHVPQGGFQSNGEGKALWEVPENQARFVALWRAIAARYAREPVIAGYDLLNEPRPTTSRKQWHDLAARAAATIREVDREHILFIERVNSVGDDWSNDGDRNLFLIEDDNAAYEFHFYSPFEYTHQHTSWTGMGEGGKYPDETVASGIEEEWINVAAFNSPSLPQGTSAWTYFEGPKLVAENPAIAVGKPALVARSLGPNGKATFDDLILKEYDEKGSYVRDVMKIDPSSLTGWYFWTRNGSGKASAAPSGHGSTPALTIAGTSDDANLGGYAYYFVPRKGYAYSLSGWMRGEAIPAGAVAQIRLDFVGSKQPITTRTKSYVERELGLYLAWGEKHGVPLYLGEFGLHRPCFEDGRGGLDWVRDVLDITIARGLHFSYHAYHEDAFGIYYGYGSRPDPARANQPLIDLFKTKLTPGR